jgi:hypothetical protein
MRTQRQMARVGRMTVRLRGEGPGRIWLGGISGNNVVARRRADRARVGMELIRQGRQVWRDKGYGLGGEAAERTLSAAMAGRRMLGRGLFVADLDAELGRIPEQRLKLGGDRHVIGAGESGRGHGRRRRGGEKLNDEREGDDKGCKRRPERGRAALSAPVPKRKFSAAEAHQTSLRCLHWVSEGTRERNCPPGTTSPHALPACFNLILFCSQQICVLSAPGRRPNVCTQLVAS